MMLDEISTLFLDMDGTLLDLNFDYQFWNTHLPARYAEIHSMEAEQAYAHVGEKLKAAQGTLSWYCTDYWSEAFNVDIMTLKKELHHLIEYRPGTEAFLNHVHATDLNVVLLTNAHPDVLEMKQEATNLLRFFDASYTSHGFGHQKEDEGFWRTLQQHVDYDRSASLMVDDSLTVLSAAKQFGTSHQLCVTHPDSRREPIDSGPFIGINQLTSLLNKATT